MTEAAGVGLCRDTTRAGAGRSQLGARSWALRHGVGRCDTARRARQARGAGARQARGVGARRQAGARGASDRRAGRQACEARQAHKAHGTGARGARHGLWARGLGVRASQGCALGALSLFLARFDSVLFLSQFFDIVREPGS